MSGSKKPYIIVLGNEKGGAGKTTTSMHVISSLLFDGYAVSSIDLDSRQRSLSNYLENRKKYMQTNQIDLPIPSHYIINNSRLDSQVEGNLDEQKRFEECLKRASMSSDFIVIDSPGNDTYLSRLAHSYADTIVTPINDSFVDLNVLAKVNDDDLRVDRHGVYSEMVWEAKIYKAQRDKGEIDWVVLRNRLTNIDAKNKRKVAEALNNFSKRVRCRLAEGFAERVIYRELFLQGLTLLDLASDKIDFNMKMSHVAARQELRRFMDFLQLEKKLAAAAEQAVAKEPSQEAEKEIVAA